ncbi:Uncharacterized conserved protein, contains ParB-like and HNH nuclease domains [Neorhodopirellula lusitana]|uniref:Uncharacterized conserved protein, contains ParB-like and HNH nuclease domains n=1 Tax=Neorhodopirellula lusitana TaxID=445327 RepID=A0ABY1QA93_9BACT|nr:DUF262 domain-containing protein [Neorhodopirellula lusitana]SMP64250.1 Uncharacterized conserved protein, contains ParB-like and HNH nuclease domains [Neorhodopirellula lusitana]
MKSTPSIKTVNQLIDLHKANMLYANPEYQRGVVWTEAQRKRLIDSVLRGYPIPLIYLHHIKREVAGITNENFEIIDGQQRINALFEFMEGGFRLYDPKEDETEARFPSFVSDAPCEWGRKRFEELTEDLQQKFRDSQLSVVMVETEHQDEARDLFIRLQAGLPLNAQEKRDAWPGNFTEFILKTSGKPELTRYPGHDFFSRILKAGKKARGKYRQLCAQIAILYFYRKQHGEDRFCDIKRDSIDNFYYQHLSFDAHNADAKRFEQILDLLAELLKDGKRKKIQGHEAMHLVLLVDSLMTEYTKSWQDGFPDAFDRFREGLATDTKNRSDDIPGEYWVRYGQHARTNSDRGENILRRHQFFVEKMYGQLNPILKDPNRAFGILEREVIYYRDKKRCQVCNSDVVWSEAQIHHVHEHSMGGQTELSNGALVHAHCHPKGEAQTKSFAENWWRAQAQS